MSETNQDVTREPETLDMEQSETGGLATGAGPGLLRLDDYGPEAVIFESGLAAMLGRCPTSLRRAVDRGELPTPGRSFGQYFWTARALAEHFQKRVEQAGKDREALARKVARLAP